MLLNSRPGKGRVYLCNFHTHLKPSFGSMRFASFASLAAVVLAASSCSRATATRSPTTPAPAGGARPAGADTSAAGRAASTRGPQPYARVIPRGATADSGLFLVHRGDGKTLWQIPDSLFGRDMLWLTRIAA